MLGNGAGTTVRAYGELFPGTEMDGVEIDGELTELGRRWFGLRDRAGLRLHEDDARPFLRRAERRWEVIMVDAYRQPYIPFYLTTREFFRLTREKLEPGGVVIVNAGHPEGSTRLERMLAAGLRDTYRHVARDPITEFNTLLIASDRPPTAAALRARHGRRGPAAAPGARGHGPAAGARARRRDGVHGRQGARRVADRPVDRQLCRGGGLRRSRRRI